MFSFYMGIDTHVILRICILDSSQKCQVKYQKTRNS